MYTCSIGHQRPKHGSHLALLRLGEFAGLGQQLHGGCPCLSLQFPVEKFAMKFIVPTELGAARMQHTSEFCVHVFASIDNSNYLFSIDSSLVVLDLMQLMFLQCCTFCAVYSRTRVLNHLFWHLPSVFGG